MTTVTETSSVPSPTPAAKLSQGNRSDLEDLCREHDQTAKTKTTGCSVSGAFDDLRKNLNCKPITNTAYL